RDFEALGPGTINGHSRGARVTRLQGLLKRIGTYGGAESGLYDAATASAVLDFQRSRYVSADGIVGPITPLAPHAAAGGEPPPPPLGGGRRQVVSSILDAREKLERTRPPSIEPVPVVVPPPHRTRVIVLVGSAFAAGAVLALGLLRSRPSVTPQVVPPPAEAPEAKQLPSAPVGTGARAPARGAPAQEAAPPSA